MKKNKSIVSKILFSIIISIVFIGLLSTILVYVYSSQVLTDDAKKVLIEETTEQSKRLSSRLNFGREITKTISKQDFVHNLLNDDNNLNYGEMVNRLNQYSINGYYSAIYIMDKDGDTLVSTDKSFVGNNYAFREYFVRALSGETYIDASVGVTSGELGYYISAPIYNNDQIIGVVVTKLRETFISEILQIESRDEANVYLADRYGVILHSTRKEDVLKTLGELNPNFKKYLIDSRRYGDSGLDPLSYSYVQNTLSDLTQTEMVGFYDAAHQENEMIAYSPILDNDFFLMMEIESDDVLVASRRISTLLAAMVFLCLLLATVVIFYSIRKYLSPLKDLSRVIAKISDGDFKSRIEITTNDELGQISSSINKMASSVDEYSSGLSEKVMERTKHLESLNKYMINRELKMTELKKKIKELEDKRDQK